MVALATPVDTTNIFIQPSPTFEPTPTIQQIVIVPTEQLGPVTQPTPVYFLQMDQLGYYDPNTIEVWNRQPPEDVQTVQIRVSYYWPRWGGINCDQVNGQDECAYTSTGQSVDMWEGHGAACVPEWPTGTLIWLDGNEYQCIDTGGAIQYQDGIPWVDFLLPYAPMSHYWGEVTTVQVLFAP
jgi:hypothetical protein